ncbi:MAG: helix-turn-helix transcriptional regulator [Planctomycetota bacterium]
MAKLRITNTIRRLRFENDEMTQQTLADRVGCTRQTIAAIEKAKYSPSLELAILIARALGKPLDEVFLVEGDDASIARKPDLDADADPDARP